MISWRSFSSGVLSMRVRTKFYWTPKFLKKGLTRKNWSLRCYISYFQFLASNFSSHTFRFIQLWFEFFDYSFSLPISKSNSKAHDAMFSSNQSPWHHWSFPEIRNISQQICKTLQLIEDYWIAVPANLNILQWLWAWSQQPSERSYWMNSGSHLACKSAGKFKIPSWRPVVHI